MSLKKIYSWLHLWLGLTVGLIFSVAAVTGTLLIFEEELEEVLYPQLYRCEVPAKGAERLPLDDLFRMAQQYAGKERVRRLIIKTEKANSSFVFQTEGDRLEMLFLALNPYNGRLQLMMEGRKHFFSVVEELHRHLLLGETGKWITGVSCLSYLVILITGLILWWPKNKKMLRQRLKIKWDAKGKRLNWDMHAVGGFYTLPIVFVVAFTGLTWSYTWFNKGIFYLMDGKGPAKYSAYFGLAPQATTSLPLELAYQRAQQLLPYRGAVNMYLPGKQEDAIEVSKEQADAAVPNVVDRLFFSMYTGDLVQESRYKDQTKGMKVRRLIFPIHTGSIGGWYTKIIYLLVMLFVSSLPFTGLFVWLGRKKKKQRKERSVGSAVLRQKRIPVAKV